MDDSVVNEKVKSMYSKTKGSRKRMIEVLPELHSLFWQSQLCKKGHWHRNGPQLLVSAAKDNGIKEQFERFVAEQNPERNGSVFGNEISVWSGGYESTVFNCLEYIADRCNPETPVLKCRMGDALLLPVDTVGKEDFEMTFKRSKINWVVQSSAVDFLHLLLVCMKWLVECNSLQDSVRFVISIHDEIWFMCKDEDRYKCAQLLQQSNLLTRAVFSQTLNLQELPQSVAFFSGVNVDRALRKEPDMKCKTPSCDGILQDYAIPDGEVLTVSEIEDKISRASRCADSLIL